MYDDDDNNNNNNSKIFPIKMVTICIVIIVFILFRYKIWYKNSKFNMIKLFKRFYPFWVSSISACSQIWRNELQLQNKSD